MGYTSWDLHPFIAASCSPTGLCTLPPDPPIMQSPSRARVMPTLTWFGSVTNPRYFFCQLFVGLLSISDRGQERTVDRITYLHSLPRKWNRNRFFQKEASGFPSTPQDNHFSTARPTKLPPPFGFLQLWRISDSWSLLSEEHML